MKFTNSITTNVQTYICDIHRRKDTWVYIVTLYAAGTFGGGTISWNWSPDGGTTILPIKSAAGTAITSTANDSFNVQFGNGDDILSANQLKIYATMAGAISPVVTVGAIDNRQEII